MNISEINTTQTIVRVEPKKTGNSLAKRVYDTSEHAWSYLGKGLHITRHLLNAGLKTCHRVTLFLHNNECKVVKVITRMKLLTVISIPFTCNSVNLAATRSRRQRKISD